MEYYDIYPEELRERKPYTLNEKPTLHQGVRLHACHIGAWTEIGPNTSMAETVFGDYSYIAGDGQIIYADVGKFCSLASHVRINPGNHPVHRVTQHHMTYRRRMYGLGDNDDQEFFNWRRAARCVIGHDVWMGHGAIIMPGVKIGIGAVIGAGAVVTRNVEPYMVVAGVPAQPIRKRFADSTITALLRIAWWHWDRATLEARFDDLMDIEKFVAKYGK